jgi:tetraacyldisaccharide 4'-kinase
MTIYESLSAVHRYYCHSWQGGPFKLPGKTISVGNLTWGGTGKTPFVTWLLRNANTRNSTTAVLSRGYKGGDEATFYKNQGFVVGVGKNRYRNGIELLTSNPGLNRWVLDDGLQHWSLHRDVDVILIDCLNPFGHNRRMIPFGILRERPEVALLRADCVILHNSSLVPSTRREEIEAEIRMWAPRDVPVIWSESKMDTSTVLPPRFVAFSGIGNNQAFRETLRRQVGVCIKFVAFLDHAQVDVERIRIPEEGDCAYVTTEKDLARSPHLAGPPLFAQAVKVEWSPIGGDLESFQALISKFFR